MGTSQSTMSAPKHDDALLTCSYGCRKEPSHFYFCREGRKAAAHLWGQQRVRSIMELTSGCRIIVSTKLSIWLKDILKRPVEVTRACSERDSEYDSEYNSEEDSTDWEDGDTDFIYPSWLSRPSLVFIIRHCAFSQAPHLHTNGNRQSNRS